MRTQIKVNVASPNAVDGATDDGALVTTPETGMISQAGTGSFESGAMGAVIGGIGILAVLIFVAVIIKKRLNKKESTVSAKKVMLGLAALALVSGVTSFGTLMMTSGEIGDASAANTSEESSDDEDSLSISASDINIDVTVDGESVYASAESKVTVNESTRFGYMLGVYADGSDLVSDGNKIKGISNEEYGEGVLTDNTWGFALEAPINQHSRVWYGMPNSIDDAILLKETYSATEAKDTTTLHYGVYVTPDLPYGTYTGPTINYVALANVVAPDAVFVFEAGEGLYFDEAGTQTTNTVGYACICEEENSDEGGMGGVGDENGEPTRDLTIPSNCRWVNVMGEYKLPIIPKGASIDAEYIIDDIGYSGFMWASEEEFLELLNEELGDYAEGQTVVIDITPIESFNVTYDANGGRFVKSCENIGGIVKGGSMDDECVPEEITVKTVKYYMGDFSNYVGIGSEYGYEIDTPNTELCGWSTNPDASFEEVEYRDGFALLPPEQGERDMILYAVWGPAK